MRWGFVSSGNTLTRYLRLVEEGQSVVVTNRNRLRGRLQRGSHGTEFQCPGFLVAAVTGASQKFFAVPRDNKLLLAMRQRKSKFAKRTWNVPWNQQFKFYDVSLRHAGSGSAARLVAPGRENLAEAGRMRPTLATKDLNELARRSPLLSTG